MSISALLPSVVPATLPLDAAPPTAAAPTASGSNPVPDTVVFSSAPLRLLSDLANAGLRQLATLLPALEQAVESLDPVPLGHLAKAAGAAARQVEEGHAALLAEGPDRVAASLTGEQRVRAAAPDQASQLLRTLARQIGSAPPQATEARASEALRAIARQIGDAAALPDRTSSQSTTTPGSDPKEPQPRQSPLGRQFGDLASLPERLLPQPTAASPAHSEEARRLGDTLARPNDGAVPQPNDPRPIPVARQIGAAIVPPDFRPAEPADAADHWVNEAQHLLHRTGDVLDQASEQLRPLTELPLPTPQIGWALSQIVAAQVQLSSAVTRLGARSKPPKGGGAAAWQLPSLSIPFEQLSHAAGLAGMLLVLVALWLAEGVWTLTMGVMGLIATAFWLFRISQAARGVTLDARR